MRHQYSFILKEKIKSYDECPCIGPEGECEILSVEEEVFCKCIDQEGEEIYKVAEGPCPMRMKSGH